MKPGVSKPGMMANLAVACLLALGFFWPIHFFKDAALWERLMDAAHFPLFFGITCWLHRLIRQGPGGTARLFKTGGLAICLAGLVEVLQPLTGRSDSMVDFRNGAAGVLAACAAVQVWETGNARRWGGWWLLAATSLFVWALWPAWQEGQGIRWRTRNFPLLGDFETPAELRLWQAQGGDGASPTDIHFTAQHVTRGARALEITTGKGSWAGVSYVAGEQNWSSHRVLAADLFNTGAEFILYVRVDDDGECNRMGQRFDREWRVHAGSNHLEIATAEMERGPEGRKLNLRGIRRLVFFTGQDQPGRTFFLDNVRLE